MKLILAIILSTASVSVSHALILANWNFNSSPPDQMVPTGSFTPDQGRGVLALVGGVEGGFAAGNLLLDLSADNSALTTWDYPPQLTGNQTAGVELKVSTLGHYNVRFVFTVQVAADAANDMQLQYTVDGSNYLNRLELPLLAAAGFLRFSNSFASVPAVEDNPNFGLRIVSQFRPPRDAMTTNGYLGSGQAYSTRGRIRFDELRVWADSFLSSQPPVRPLLSQVTIPENTARLEVPFPLSAPGYPPEALAVEVYSSHEALLPRDGATLTGAGTNRMLILRPARDRIGVGRITLCLSTPKGHFTTTDFTVTVNPVDPPPLLGSLEGRTILVNESITIPFFVGGGISASSPVFFTTDVSNSTLTPPDQVRVIHEGTNHFLSIVPAQNQIGSSSITLLAWDRYQRVGSNTFVLSVRPSTRMLVCEPFTYHGGSLISNAPGLWMTHSGTPGQIPIINGQPWLVGSQSEDVSVTLPNGPYTPASGAVLYAGFDLIGRVLATAAGQYFAHFNTASFRGRVAITTENASAGCYRVGIANNSGDPEWYQKDLKLAESYRLIIRYEVGSGMTTLWLDPNSEQDAGLAATDLPGPTTVTAFGLRQAPGIGSVSIDNLKVSTSFDEVARRFPPFFMPTRHGASSGEVQWVDDIYGYVLDLATNGVGSWKPLDGEPYISADGTRFISFDQTKQSCFYQLRATNSPPWILRSP